MKSEDHVPRPDTGAILLAKLRLDGFVSLDAGAAPGQLVTKPLTWNGTGLHVNVDAPRGSIRAEILDAATQRPIPGFEMSRSTEAGGDRLDAVIRWKGADPSKLANRPVRLRFELRQASLYAHWTR